MFGAAQTRKGRVVYDRAKHVFSGRDMTRIVISVNNNNTGNWVNWQAVFHIAQHNYHAGLEVETRVLKRKQYDKFFQDLNTFLNFLDQWIVPLFGRVPGVGSVIELINGVCSKLRQAVSYSISPIGTDGDE